MQSRIDNVILDAEFIKSFNISFGRRGAYWNYGYCSYGVLNELIGRILMQDIHHEGFEQITLSAFLHFDDELNVS